MFENIHFCPQTDHAESDAPATEEMAEEEEGEKQGEEAEEPEEEPKSKKVKVAFIAPDFLK